MFRYLKFYFEPKHKDLREKAMEAARAYYADKPVRSRNNPYPLPGEYEYRRMEFQAFQRGYISGYRATYAKAMAEQYSAATLAVQNRLNKSQ